MKMRARRAKVKDEWKIDLSHVQEAQRALAPLIEPTPLVRSKWLSELLGCDLFLKLESMHPIGSFKIRGATYRISQLTREERKRGVLAASAGNHAQGVAWGAQTLGVQATIVMPVTAPLVKVENTRALGAEIIQHGANFDEAKAHGLKLAKQRGKVWIPAFEDPRIIAGQGTIALELLEQCPDLDVVIGAVGGGGMLAGIGTVLSELRPEARLIACQAAGAPSMVQSHRSGHAIKLEQVRTFADGIAVREASARLLKILDPRVNQWVTIEDEKIAEAVLLLLEKAKVVAEGSGAIALAAALSDPVRKRIRGKKVVAVVSGGNIDVNLLGRIIDRGMLQTGRRVRISVWLSDRPGSLALLTRRLAELEANILQAIHDQNAPSAHLDETEVALTLETRGAEHVRQILSSLKSQYRRVEIVHS